MRDGPRGDGSVPPKQPEPDGCTTLIDMRLTLALVFVLASCTIAPVSMMHPDVGVDAARDDSGLSRADAGDAGSMIDAATPIDVGAMPDVGLDANAMFDANTHDGGADTNATPDANTHDGGVDANVDANVHTPPVIDGVVGVSEWAAATSASNSSVSIWTSANTLTTLRAIAISGTLYVAVEGQVGMTNAMVIYFDGGSGTGIANLSTLGDTVGALDHAMSAGFTTPTASRWDLGWGTTLMSHGVMGADDTTGFRNINSTPTNFGWIVASTAQTACSATACEAAIPTSMLPGTAPRTIAMFARITNSDGSMSPNQTLPMDAPATPRVVTVLMTISE